MQGQHTPLRRGNSLTLRPAGPVLLGVTSAPRERALGTGGQLHVVGTIPVLYGGAPVSWCPLDLQGWKRRSATWGSPASTRMTPSENPGRQGSGGLPGLAALRACVTSLLRRVSAVHRTPGEGPRPGHPFPRSHWCSSP